MRSGKQARCGICYQTGHNRRAHAKDRKGNPIGPIAMKALWTADAAISVHKHLKRHRRGKRSML
jgi:hypothetical protein